MVPTGINASELSSKLPTAPPPSPGNGQVFHSVFGSQHVAICSLNTHQEYPTVISSSLKPSHLGCRLPVLLPLQMSTFAVHVAGHTTNARLRAVITGPFLMHRGPHSMSLPLRSPRASPRQEVFFSPPPLSFGSRFPWGIGDHLGSSPGYCRLPARSPLHSELFEGRHHVFLSLTVLPSLSHLINVHWQNGSLKLIEVREFRTSRERAGKSYASKHAGAPDSLKFTDEHQLTFPSK